MADNIEARLNVTWNGKNGDLPDPVPYDAGDGDIKAWAAEAIRNGDIPGIDVDPNVNFGDFIVDRFGAHEDLPNRLFLRPKTPFGSADGTALKLGVLARRLTILVAAVALIFWVAC